MEEPEKEKEILSEEFPILFSLEVKNTFHIPEMYFNTAEELTLLQNKLTTHKTYTFKVPENYFEESKNKLFTCLAKESRKKITFDIPENFFSEQAGIINTGLYLNEFKEKEHFTIPENYFNKNKKQLDAICSTNRKIPIRLSWKTSDFFALAACISSICLILLFILKQKSNEKIQLSSIHLDEIRENPEDFDLDEFLIADLESNEKIKKYPSIERDSLINELIQDPFMDINSYNETE